ncbi:NADP-dependent oxidoreductase domain-containing protein [Fomes fomentarius]|nr:NADP-dependent oxidoreductase domain-containing protein [Fomes fomentarius]
MVKTTKLGGTASDVVVAKVAHGLMTMSMTPTPAPDEVYFEAIKSGIDALPPGTKAFLNSGEFYGANLQLLARFFAKYPEYADKTFLSVKAEREGFSGNPQELREKVRNTVDKCISLLEGTKKIDLFQPARLHPDIAVEETVRALAELVKEGKFDHIGLSEVRAETLRRGHAVHSIAVVEIEVSPMSYEDETKKVLATAQELGVAVAAYSPLGHGLTTGTIQTTEDLARNPFHQYGFSRFQEENWKYNKRLIDALIALAAKKGCTPAQLSIAWVASLGEKVLPLPSSSRKERTLENLHGADVELSAADLEEIKKILDTNPVHGHRYVKAGDQFDKLLWG